MIKDHTVQKIRGSGKRDITLSKDPKGYGYNIQMPLDRKIINTTSYVLPDYAVDHGQKAKNGQMDNIGTFLDGGQSKIGSVNNTEYNEQEILDSLSMDDENTPYLKHEEEMMVNDENDFRNL